MHDPVTGNVSSVSLAAPSTDAPEPWHPQCDDTSLDVRFVRICGRVALSPALATQLREVGETLDAAAWQRVPFSASASGMSPLVFRHAAQTGLLGGMPSETAAVISDAYRQTLVTNRGLQREQDTLLAACAAKGIAVITLKGITLAERYYHDIALRPIHDIDWLVRRGDLRRVRQILKGLGYEPLRGHTRLWNFVALLGADLSYARAGGAKIELHWELTHRPAYRQGLSARAAMQRCQATELRGQVVRHLSTADELRFLCVHCTVDHPVTSVGVRLIWLVDIAELVRTLPEDWNWPAFLQETIALRLATPVAVALAHCQMLLDLELPPRVLKTLRAAADTPPERTAWRTAQIDIFSAEGLQAHLRAIHGIGEIATFARGILLPEPAWIRKHYGHLGDTTLPLWRGYVHYFSRLLIRFAGLLVGVGRRWTPRGRRSAR